VAIIFLAAMYINMGGDENESFMQEYWWVVLIIILAVFVGISLKLYRKGALPFVSTPSTSDTSGGTYKSTSAGLESY
jgi:hypothetical protein